MGDKRVTREYDHAEMRDFTLAVLNDLQALEHMLADGMLESGVRRIGAEQEMFLIDRAMRPAPIVEEVIYRGILFSAFQRTLGAVLAIIAVTLLFALVHVPQYYPSISTIALLLLLSLILTLVRAWTGNLLPCIILHTIFNGTQSLLLILEPYIKASAPTVEPAASVFLK